MTSIPSRVTAALFGCALVSGPIGGAMFAQTTPATPAATESSSAAFAQSLVLRTDRVVADSTRLAYAWLGQTSVVSHAAKEPLQLKVGLAPWDGDAKPVKELGTFTIYGGNLATTPVPFAMVLDGVPNGYYRYVADVWEGDTKLVTLTKPVALVAGLEQKQADIGRRLERVAARDTTRVSVVYPFDLARVINLGKRVLGSGNGNPEFGLSQAGVQQYYDFTAGLKASEELLAQLEKGNDPLWRAGGDHVRHHFLEDADEILPYRVYVPSTWDGKTALPLVLILHGNSRDHNFYLDRDGGIIPKTAEKHGFMLVSPLGYYPNGGYNYVPFNRERPATTVPAQTFGAAPSTGGRGGRGPGFGGVNGSTIPAAVRSAWSEADVMRVFERVRKEYPIDDGRVYLFGYSAGGQGAHYLGQKYPENWTAIAIGGSNAAPGPSYRFEPLKKIPMLLFSGSADGVLNATRTMAQALERNGVKATFTEINGANHDTAPGMATPDVFEFFKANAIK